MEMIDAPVMSQMYHDPSQCGMIEPTESDATTVGPARVRFRRATITR